MVRPRWLGGPTDRRGLVRRLVDDDPTESAWLIQRRRDERGRETESWTVTFSVGSYRDISMQVPGRDEDTGELLTEEDVIKMVIALFDDKHPELGTGEWRTIVVRIDGKSTVLTFRGTWVAAFAVESNVRGSWE